MVKLTFKQVTQQILDLPFDCVNESINEYIKDSYFPLITQKAYTYGVMQENILLGFYQLMFREIGLNDFPEKISGYCWDFKQEISAVHIHFIAINKKFQGNKIGTSVVKTIIKQVKQLSKDWPIRVITLDAIEMRDEERNPVKWYTNLGFERLTRNRVGQEGVTVPMYYDCMNFADDLLRYEECI